MNPVIGLDVSKGESHHKHSLTEEYRTERPFSLSIILKDWRLS